jgi:regulator of cell morphogenesis and NO signaling
MTNDLVAPACACAMWRSLYAGLRIFRDDLAAHISIENDILFARFAPSAMRRSH